MKREFTKFELLNLALGYSWTPEMGLDEFIKANSNVTYETGYELFEIINQRYIEQRYEISED